jgi:hypothetical protein
MPFSGSGEHTQHPYQRFLGYEIDEKGRPVRQILLHEDLPHDQQDTPDNIVTVMIPPAMKDPRWMGTKWMEAWLPPDEPLRQFACAFECRFEKHEPGQPRGILRWLIAFLLGLILGMLAASSARAQSSFPGVQILPNAGGPPGGVGTACSFLQLSTQTDAQHFFACGGDPNNPTWFQVDGGGGGATSWSSITAPTGNLSLTMAAHTSLFTFNAATGAGVNLFDFTDTLNNTGTGAIVRIRTASGSAAIPLQIFAQGTTNGLHVDTSGIVQKDGSGGVAAAAVTSLPGLNGQLLYNNAGAIGAEDPIVSGPTAIGAAPATNPVFTAGYDGTNIRAFKFFDLDSGAGTDYNVGVNLRTTAGGGSAETGVAANPLQVSLANTGANATAVKVDGSAVTQPVSAASLPLPTGAATAAKQPAIGTAGTPSTDVITVQGIGSMTPISSNLYVGGNAVTTANPVPIQPPASGYVTVNLADVNGNAALAGNGATGTGSPRVTVASDNSAIGNWGQGATGAAVPANAVQVGYTDGTNLKAPYLDPCEGTALTTVAISQTASTKVISAAASKKNYICSLVIVAGAAEIVSVVEGTGSTCATGTAALAGSTTTANGMSFAANGGLSAIGGNHTAIAGSGSNVDTCLFQNGSNRVSGWLTYVQR